MGPELGPHLAVSVDWQGGSLGGCPSSPGHHPLPQWLPAQLPRPACCPQPLGVSEIHGCQWPSLGPDGFGPHPEPQPCQAAYPSRASPRDGAQGPELITLPVSPIAAAPKGQSSGECLSDWPSLSFLIGHAASEQGGATVGLQHWQVRGGKWTRVRNGEVPLPCPHKQRIDSNP